MAFHCSECSHAFLDSFSSGLDVCTAADTCRPASQSSRTAESSGQFQDPETEVVQALFVISSPGCCHSCNDLAHSLSSTACFRPHCSYDLWTVWRGVWGRETRPANLICFYPGSCASWVILPPQGLHRPGSPQPHPPHRLAVCAPFAPAARCILLSDGASLSLDRSLPGV